MVQEEDIPEIVTEHLLKGNVVKHLLYEETVKADKIIPLNETNFYKKQHRVALRNCGVINPEKIDEYKSEIEALNTQLENSKAELAKPFLKEQELKTKLARQSELDRQLNLDNKENLLGKDNVKSFELETEADRQKLNSHNSMQKKDIKSYDLEL